MIGIKMLSIKTINYSHRQYKQMYSFYLRLAVLSLCCCMGFSLVTVSGGHSLVAVHRFLIEVASLIVQHGL